MTFPREAFIEKAKNDNHSEEYIAKALDYISKLEDRGFPVIFSLPHLAMEVGMQSNYIKSLIKTKNYQYTFFLMQKKNKNAAAREIMAPQKELKFLQRWINFNILQKVIFNEHIHGFVPNSSILKHAQVHKNAKYLLKIDLLKFFDCISTQQVYKVFRSFGYIKNLAWDFTEICTA